MNIEAFLNMPGAREAFNAAVREAVADGEDGAVREEGRPGKKKKKKGKKKKGKKTFDERINDGLIRVGVLADTGTRTGEAVANMVTTVGESLSGLTATKNKLIKQADARKEGNLKIIAAQHTLDLAVADANRDSAKARVEADHADFTASPLSFLRGGEEAAVATTEDDVLYKAIVVAGVVVGVAVIVGGVVMAVKYFSASASAEGGEVIELDMAM